MGTIHRKTLFRIIALPPVRALMVLFDLTSRFATEGIIEAFQPRDHMRLEFPFHMCLTTPGFHNGPFRPSGPCSGEDPPSHSRLKRRGPFDLHPARRDV